MTLRNVPKSHTLEQQRLEINEIAVDLDTAVDGVQTFGGDKTFTGDVIFTSDASFNQEIHSTTGGLILKTADQITPGQMVTEAIFGGSMYVPYGFSTYPIAYFPGGGISETSTNDGVTIQSGGSIFISNSGASAVWKGRQTGTLGITSEIDAPGNATFAGTVTASGGDSSDWNTAYGWGDHSAVGYLTSYTEADTLASVTGRGSTTNENLTFNGTTDLNNTIQIADNKVMNFGASQDGRIAYVSSTNRFIVRVPGGSGDLILGAGPAIRITNENGLTDRAVFTASGATLNGNINLTGNIDVTGTATLSGVTFPSSTGSNGEVLTSDGAGGTAWGPAVPSGNSSVIAPVAYAFVDVATAGSGTGMSWGAYDAANGEMDFTFGTTQADADYYVLAEREQYDTHTVSITNKTTTGFKATWLGNDGVTPLSPSTFGGVLLVYASTPTVSVVGGGGGSNYVLPTASASTLGGIKVGSGLTINTGVLSTSGSSSYSTISNFPSASSSEGSFGYADDTSIMYYSNGASWTSQRLVTTNSTTSSDFATLLSDTQLTYDINVVDYTTGTTAENDARKIIRLEDSDGTSDQIVLVAGNGLAISDSGDEIQFDLTASIANTTYSISAETAAGSANSNLTLTDNDGTTDEITFAGADGLIVERTDANTLTFRQGAGSVTQYTDNAAKDAAAQSILAGSHTGISFNYDSVNKILSATSSGGGGSSSILYDDVSSFPAVAASESKFAYADDTGIMYYSNGVSWTSQRLVTTNSTTSSDFATLLGNTQLTYDINVVDYTAGTTAENLARKIIRLEDSDGTTDQIVLVAGTGLAISDSGDEIQIDLTADIANSTYSISAETSSGNADSVLRLTDNAGTTDNITFAGADGLLVERTDANTLTFRAPSGASGGSYTTEDAQDAAALLFSNGTHTGINFTYNDSNNSIDAVVTGGGSGGTTYDLLGSNTTSSNAILTLRDAANNDDTIEFTGSNGTDVAWDGTNSKITINSIAPVQSDWDATTGLAQILNKPSIPSAYTLPAATTSTLGGVIPDGTTITLDANGNIAAVAGGYTLPIADASTLGGIKVGSGLSIDAAGVLTATGGSNVPQIQDLTGTTTSIVDDATAELNITGYKAYTLFKIETDAAAWVRVYTDDTSRDADQTRSEGADPSPGSGVIAEVRTTTAESILITPGIMGFNNDSPRTTTIYLSVTNRSGSASTVTVTLTALQIGE